MLKALVVGKYDKQIKRLYRVSYSFNDTYCLKMKGETNNQEGS